NLVALHFKYDQARRRFVEWAQNEIAVVPDFHKRILFSDEAHFWLNGYVNKQNCRIWSEANPQVYVETPLHPEKTDCFGALYGLVESFFQNDEGHNVTVNGDRYRAMITNFFIPELNNHDVQELWSQQDGATCHTARATIDLLKDTFGDRLISRFGPVNWPPRSCDLTLQLDRTDFSALLERLRKWTARIFLPSRGRYPVRGLTPLDYFLWGYVNSLVYADKPQTLDHLEDNIRRVIADIRPQMLEKVIENWTSRLDYIRASRGIHMPEIIFKIDTLSEPSTSSQPEASYIFTHKAVFSELLQKVPCKYCTNCTLVIKQHHSMGYSTKMELLCESCHESYGSVFSSFQEEAKNSHDINSKLVSAFLSIGRGYAALETFSFVLNMPTKDRKTFAKCMHNLSVKNKEVEKKMLEMSRQAAREAHVKVDVSLRNQEIIDVSVSYDGAWQKRGHTSKD
ncbi:uncharacterized protein TNCV_4283981, partial [Trichonephila clavipes]